MVNSTFNICQLNKLTFTKIAWFYVQLTFVELTFIQLTFVQLTCVLEWGQAPKPPGFVALARHYAVRQAEPSDKQFVWGMKLLLSWLLLNKKLLNWPTVQLCYWWTCHLVNFFLVNWPNGEKYLVNIPCWDVICWLNWSPLRQATQATKTIKFEP